MTDSLGLPAGEGHRLHPVSPFYELVFNLANMVPTILGMGLVASSDRFASWGLIGMVAIGGVTLLYSVIAARRLRYWLTDSDLVIRSGVFGKSVRRIPWERVENVQRKRNLLHRLSGVAEVVVEAGGGLQAEAKLRVLGLEAADAFEQAVRARRGVAAGGIADATESADGQTLLRLDWRELVRAGLISNQGWLAVGAMVALAYQFDDFLPVRSWIGDAGKSVVDSVGLDHGLLFWLALLVALVLAGFIAMRVLSISWWLVLFHDFELHLVDHKLSAEHGLLTRVRGAAHLRRVQRLLVLDGVLHRLFKRQAIQVGVAGQKDALNETDSLRWLAPVVRREQRSALLRAAMPVLDEGALDWQPLHRSSVWRVWLSHALFVPLLLILFGIAPTLAWLAIVGALLLITIDAVAYARFAGYALSTDVVAFRSGFLDRQTWYVPIDRIEWVAVTTSPMDRANATASILIELRTRGPGGRARIPLLPIDEAQALATRLRGLIRDRSAAGTLV
jgi:putative membrane protein